MKTKKYHQLNIPVAIRRHHRISRFRFPLLILPITAKPSVLHTESAASSLGVRHSWPLSHPRLDLIFSITLLIFPSAERRRAGPRTLAISPPTGGHRVTERRRNEKHLIVWGRFSTASVREPAELFAQNQVKTCHESRWVALSRVSYGPTPRSVKTTAEPPPSPTEGQHMAEWQRSFIPTCG